MYFAILAVLLGFAGITFFRGIFKKKKLLILGGVVLALATFGFIWFLDFWGEKLWFEALGYEERFFTVFYTQSLFFMVGTLFGLGFVWLLTLPFHSGQLRERFIAILIGGFIGASWASGNWDIFLKFWYRIDTGLTEPILGQDVGFYLFSLPFLENVYSLLISLIVISVLAAFASTFLQFERTSDNTFKVVQRDYNSADNMNPLYVAGGILLMLLAVRLLLDRYNLMYSSRGAVSGPGWTDVNILLPAYLILSIITFIIGMMVVLPPLRKIWLGILGKISSSLAQTGPLALGLSIGLVFLLWFIGLSAIPSIFQWLRVEPNEITFERQYIENNIRFTRHGYRLHEVEEKEYPASEKLSRDLIENNRYLLDNVRLWDWRALDAVYKQFQEIRLYYEFNDVDIDRYKIDGQTREVMVSAREMKSSNLPTKSQTFVNERFKYTHGYGITLTNVNEFTPDGLPNLLIRDIPPKASFPELEVKRPQIYYGELTDSHVVVNTKEKEFDYPQQNENVYVNYEGDGGVQLSSKFRQFLYGWKFDGTKFFLSNYPTKESRIMFRRQIKDRVSELAPFLELDDDPYIVLDDGKLYWMLDAYTTSSYYPYSEPFSSVTRFSNTSTYDLENQLARELGRENYIRNSVKIVVDAYDGSVDFYTFDEEDPLIKVWDKIFPGLLQPKSEMPDGLLQHIRYPTGLLLIQGIIYSKYHMEDPIVFYNQEDLWVRATEKYYEEVRPVSPYYIIWEQPESDKAEFVLMQPFTPKNKQVMIGWIAGMCDPENYGRFLAYKFPKDRRVLGPQQVETKIDQDSYLSGQLSLWDQRGSKVIRGNVLAIPLEGTLLYVEPIYLQAETAAYPELRLVAVMHNDQLSYAETFGEALEGLFEGVPVAAKQSAASQDGQPISSSQEGLIREANQAFQDYKRLTGDGQFQQASQALQRLQNTLQQLTKDAGQEEEETKSNMPMEAMEEN